MKTSILSTIVGSAAIVVHAAPVDHNGILVRAELHCSSSDAVSSLVAAASSSLPPSVSSGVILPTPIGPGTGLPYSVGTSLSFPYPSGTGFPYPTGTSFPYPTGTWFPYPTGTGPPIPTGTGTALPYPSSTTCSQNGELICDGALEFGICLWGHVEFHPVAPGTECRDGKIVFTPGGPPYPPRPSPPSVSESAVPGQPPRL